MMKFKFFCLFAFFVALIFGMKVAGKSPNKMAPVSSESNYPLSEHKMFVVAVYGYNQADWCERSLSSIVSQDYDHFRVVFIDDASSDETFSKAEIFVEENNQKHRVALVRNDAHLGETLSLYRAIDSCLDREIVIPLVAKDWFAHSNVLEQLNRAYQNPNLWLTLSSAIVYPTYEVQEPSEDGSPVSLYAALFKQMPLADLVKLETVHSCLKPLTELAKNHFVKLKTPSFFENKAHPTSLRKQVTSISSYQPLAEFPKSVHKIEKTDVLVFSCDRPLQLYACLESIDRYMRGFETLTVLYRASNENFAKGYQELKIRFPHVRFIAQSNQYKKDFKPLLMKAVFNSPSKYILFGVDDIVVKDETDLGQCMEMMEKTKAYGFYLRFGKHISYCYQSGSDQPLPPSLSLIHEVYAWSLDQGSQDWGFPNSLDMTLYRKSDLKSSFEKIKFKTPNSLEFCWATQCRPKGALGLYFESSKILNIPFNVVSRTGNPHMNYLSAEELLVKFEEGLKMDIEPLYKIENPSPHFEYVPSLITR